MTRRREAGLSVMEVMVIVLVIGIIVAIAVPGLMSAQRAYRLSSAAQAVAQNLQLCRQTAVSTNLPTSIQFQTSGQVAVAVIDSNNNGTFGDDGGGQRPPDREALTLSAENCTITGAGGETDDIVRSFSSRGELPLGADPDEQDITITYAGNSRTVTIDPRGQITVGPQL
jgi:Tfp pilus assembly protein FimT